MDIEGQSGGMGSGWEHYVAGIKGDSFRGLRKTRFRIISGLNGWGDVMVILSSWLFDFLGKYFISY